MSQQQQKQQQSKKLTPNLDEQTTKVLNLTVLQRMDPFIDQILFTAAHVSFYDFNLQTNQWSRKDVEGSLFVVKRNSQPRFQFIVMNRRNTDNLVENLLDFEYELKKPYLLYRNAAQDVNGIWFYNPDECEEVANLFNRILNAYPKAAPNATLPSTKSEFEEHEPVTVITESSLELSSATASANDAVEDPVFTNYFSPSTVAGNHASNVDSFRQPYHPATVNSTASSGLMPPLAPVVQIPSASRSASAISVVPLNFIERVNSGNQINTNLLKPSTFFPTTSSLLIPPISSPLPPIAVLNSLNQQRQYGAPMLQPFPPPNPPPLSPISGSTPNKPDISRDKVRDALLSLAQDDQFIDMMFQTLVKLNN